MEFTDYMLWKLAILGVGALVYGIYLGFKGH